jgi:colanic acid/amylovoran biosynthesis glycosyltransferase
MTSRPAPVLGYLVSQYPTTSHTFVLREIRALRARGLEIAVISIRPPDREGGQMSGEEAEEYRRTWYVLGSGAAAILAAHVLTLLRAPLRYLGAMAYAARLAGPNPVLIAWHLCYFAEAVVAGAEFRRRGVTHIHAHFSTTVALLLCRVFPITFSATIHGSDEFNDMEGFHMSEKVAAARFIATISRFGASQTMRGSDSQYWHKVLMLPLGVDPEVLTPGRRPGREGVFEILQVGRLVPVKAHEMLLSAIALLVAEGRTNIRLTLVGDGPSRPAIEAKIARCKLEGIVTLAGAVNHDQVSGYYRRAHAFVLSSFLEGVPVVLMEAMSMEVPCIATWVAGVPELIRDGVDGLLVPPADAGAIACALKRLMDDAGLCAQLGASARQRVCEHYNLSRNTEALGEALRAILAVGE